MTDQTNRRIVLASRPTGEPEASNFRMQTVAIPKPGEGQLLLRTLFLSLDPYMRGRMSDAPSYAKPVEIGEVMEGGTVNQVLESRSPQFTPGDIVLAYTGWQEYAVTDAKYAQKLDPSVAPISTALGVLGMPGMTAYTGLLNIGQPKAGETVAVAAASGAVGSIVGQIATIKECRAVGIAGGRQKCDFVRNELGFDDCVDHRSPSFAEELKGACPKGIDVYFENVGGPVFAAVRPLLNPFSRIPVCGLISQYNAPEPPPGPDTLPKLMRDILTKRLLLRGFIVSDYQEQRPDFLRDVTGWIREGRVKYREDIVDGLENAVSAFQGLLKGQNFGKLLVRLGERG